MDKNIKKLHELRDKRERDNRRDKIIDRIIIAFLIVVMALMITFLIFFDKILTYLIE